MERITITIENSGAAFDDEPGEVARILRKLADRLAGAVDITDDQFSGMALMDINGNRAGTVTVED